MSSPGNASRRDALKTVALAASGAAVAVAVTPRIARTRNVASAPAAADPATHDASPRDLEDLVGKQLGPYRVESVGGIERGGIPVQLAFGAQVFRVDVLRADPSESRGGIGTVSSVSVYLRNGGDGQTATDEMMGLGAMALADELARRERDGWKPPSALMTMGERSALDSFSVG